MADQSLPGGILYTTPAPSSGMNHKALRKARKSAGRVAKGRVCEANEQEACARESPSIDTRPIEDTVQYECFICGDDFIFSEGVAHCTEHFMCNNCVVHAYNAALADTEAFPARCCTPLPRRLVEHLLTPEVLEAYSLKAQEYYTPRAIRVYCANESCRSFIPRSHVDNSHAFSTVAHCGCGTNTCVGCQYEWEGQEHRCVVSDEPGMRPKWMPEYSSSCRAKSCPNCRVWMEHKEACNHMTCHYCRHEFCFVCLLPWTNEGFHQDEGCPSYGDPVEGHDEQGYELGARGLHRDSGYSRAGLNRLGQRQLSHAITQHDAASDGDGYNDPDFDDHGYHDELDDDIDYGDERGYEDDELEYDEDDATDEDTSDDGIETDPADPAQVVHDPEDEAEQDGQTDHVDIESELSWIEGPQVHSIEDGEVGEVDTVQSEADVAAPADEVVSVGTKIVTPPDPAPARPRPSPPSDLVRQQIRLNRRVPILAPRPHDASVIFDGGTPSFLQLNCIHSWRRKMLYATEYSYSRCKGCTYRANSWTNFCSICGLVACDWCTQSFRYRFLAEWECAASMVDVFIWAEKGVVPFTAERRRKVKKVEDEIWADCDEDTLGLARLIKVFDAQLSELQPFLYYDFGISSLFEELELEMLKDYWAVTEEDVGIPGLTMTFDLARNFFAPLRWDEST